MFAVSTSLRDLESEKAIDSFAREFRDHGADGVALEAGLSEERVRILRAALGGADCPILAITAPTPRAPGFDRDPSIYLRLSPSSPDTQERAAAERGWLRTLELAADVRAPVVVLRLGRVALPPGTPDLAALLEGERLGSPRALAYARDAIARRGEHVAAHYDAVRRSLEAALGVAERRGVSLALAQAGSLEELPSFRELERLLAEFEGAPLGYWIDPASAFVLEKQGLKPAAAWIERFADAVRGGDLRDAREADDVLTRDLLPGTGVLDFAALRTALGDRAGIFALSLREGDPGLTREALSHLRRAGWLR